MTQLLSYFLNCEADIICNSHELSSLKQLELFFLFQYENLEGRKGLKERAIIDHNDLLLR